MQFLKDGNEKNSPLLIATFAQNQHSRACRNVVMVTKMANQPATLQNSGNKIKELFRKYGRVAIGVHIVVYTSFLTGRHHCQDGQA